MIEAYSAAISSSSDVETNRRQFSFVYFKTIECSARGGGMETRKDYTMKQANDCLFVFFFCFFSFTVDFYLSRVMITLVVK